MLLHDLENVTVSRGIYTVQSPAIACTDFVGKYDQGWLAQITSEKVCSPSYSPPQLWGTQQRRQIIIALVVN